MLSTSRLYEGHTALADTALAVELIKRFLRPGDDLPRDERT